jgi:hypothetical protein
LNPSIIESSSGEAAGEERTGRAPVGSVEEESNPADATIELAKLGVLIIFFMDVRLCSSERLDVNTSFTASRVLNLMISVSIRE